ncbi:MAG: hypothetical protein E7548_01060 [Ruminococcaceae bacterium]|nr:hypothetical protein [Oscillospiraceae bacterium]
MKNKKQRTRFFRSLKISSILLFCLCILVAGLMITYEQMQIISFGEYKKAVEFGPNYFRFLDLVIY